MAPRYRRVAVIGGGPSGLAATHALAAEKAFDKIRVFERRDRVGGLWHYDPEPAPFPSTTGVPPPRNLEAPAKLPEFSAAADPDPFARSALYYALDSNVGAGTMAFTHTPFPEVNSAISVQRFGHGNPSRPYQVITGWIEDLFKPFLPFVSLNTTVERVEKRGNEWLLTLRKAREIYRGEEHDYWWTETFDGVVVASGHYNVPFIPDIPGLIETLKAYPAKFEHSKSYRKPEKYVNKRVVLVGGNISASDFINDLHLIVKSPLEVSIRGKNEALTAAYNLPNVRSRPPVKSFSPENGGTVIFDDDSSVEGVDHILFATGYRLSYPFLVPNPVTPENRLAGFYQHVFKIDDPSLAVVGQVRGALSFRVFEYQAVGIARYFAGRSRNLPSIEQQKAWESERIKVKGSRDRFHEINPDFEEYFNWFVNFAGKPEWGTDSYELPKWEADWGPTGFALLALKGKYWQSIIDSHALRAKL